MFPLSWWVASLRMREMGTASVFRTMAVRAKKIVLFSIKSDKSTINFVRLFHTTASGPTAAVSLVQECSRRVPFSVLNRTSGWAHLQHNSPSSWYFHAQSPLIAACAISTGWWVCKWSWRRAPEQIRSSHAGSMSSPKTLKSAALPAFRNCCWSFPLVLPLLVVPWARKPGRLW